MSTTSTSSFSIPFFSRKSKGSSSQRQPTRKEILAALVNHNAQPNHTQSLPGGYNHTQSLPVGYDQKKPSSTAKDHHHTHHSQTLRPRTNSLSTPKPSPASTMRGYKAGAGTTHTFVNVSTYNASSGAAGGARQVDGSEYREMMRRAAPSSTSVDSGSNRYIQPDRKQRHVVSQSHSQHGHSQYSQYSQHSQQHYSPSQQHHTSPVAKTVVISADNNSTLRGRPQPQAQYQQHQRHISRPQAIPLPTPQLTPVATPTSTLKHTPPRAFPTIPPHVSPPTIGRNATRNRRGSENQAIDSGEVVLLSDLMSYDIPATFNGHSPIATGPSSATSIPGPISDWAMEESDEYDEDSEGPLDPLEVLESFYHEIPLPPWMAAVLIEDASIASATASAAASAAASPSTPTSASASTHPLGPFDPLAPPGPRRSHSTSVVTTTGKDARSPTSSRTPFSLPFTGRIRRTSSVNQNSDSISAAPKVLREASDGALPIHQRPLPPVPSPSGSAPSGSLRQRLLRSRHASDMPDEPSAIPEDGEYSNRASSELDAPISAFALRDRPSSIVNHIIPPEERAAIGRRRYDSQSSFSSDDESSLAPSVQTLQLPLQLASMPSSPFGSTHKLPPTVPAGLSPPPRMGLNPPPRPRSRVTPGPAASRMHAHSAHSASSSRTVSATTSAANSPPSPRAPTLKPLLAPAALASKASTATFPSIPNISRTALL